MKQLILFLAFLSASFFSNAHDFFFAYAEVEINEVNQKVEATIYATTHDLEKSLRDESGKEIKIYGNEEDPEVLSLLERKINEGFRIKSGDSLLTFKLEGVEVKLNGTIFFYLSSELKSTTAPLTIRFDFLMDTFQEQQNKLDLKFRGNTTTYAFLLHNKECVIQLSKNNE